MSDALATREPPMDHGVDLADLLAGIVPGISRGISIPDLTADSRSVTKDALFLALPGISGHGVAFAAEAAARGARVVLWDPVRGYESPRLPAGIVAYAIPDLRRHAGTIADRFFAMPSAELAIAGITGTNGKTTCAHLIAAALERDGWRGAYSGTLGYGVVDSLRPVTHTTPDCVTVHRQLAALRDAGHRYVGMEVSSHALDQERVAGVRFDTAVFTNLTRDHLDYHGTLEAYGAAKARLFSRPGLKRCAINIDDPFGREIANRMADHVAVTAYWTDPRREEAIGEHYFRAREVRPRRSGLELHFASSRGSGVIRSRLIGDFNADNLLAALAVLTGWGMPLAEAVGALAACSAPPGRMETFGAGIGQPLVVVDYAHTPDALRKALRALRRHAPGRLFCVFGCGGDRDPGKRPMMGAIAEEIADVVVLTDDNPRSEDPSRIVAAIQRGMQEPRRARVLHDREAAIHSALAEAGPTDAVLVAGKGHEDYQIVGAEVRALSDRAIVRAALGSAG
jgi:UDP-N-acetylmuramoyl-L-alanyl-D-glutamate--2,6-diaminopimelate ligase